MPRIQLFSQLNFVCKYSNVENDFDQTGKMRIFLRKCDRLQRRHTEFINIYLHVQNERSECERKKERGRERARKMHKF